MIKRLKEELSDAQSLNNQIKSPKGQGAGGVLAHSAGLAQRNQHQNMLRSANSGGGAGGYVDDIAKGNEDLINFLEQKLEQQERNMVVKGQEYEALLQEH